MKKPASIPVVVTTAHNGVFFGYGDADSTSKTITITQARMCVYWSADVQGVLGLAANGPSASCKVGPAAPKILLQDVTSIMECSPAATKRWESGPWK